MENIKKAPVAFVAMCFDKRLHDIYQKAVKPVFENHGYRCLRADEMVYTGLIIEQIRKSITNADIILCDLTFENPNVFYELAISHMERKETIMISQNAANIPFDVRNYKIILYNDNKLGLLDLRTELELVISSIDLGSERENIPHKKIVPIDDNEIISQRSNLFSNSIDVKRFAIKVLGDCRDKGSYKQIRYIASKKDIEPDILRDAFTALHKIDPNKAVSDLIYDGLITQNEYLVRERVIFLLGLYPPEKILIDHMTLQISDSSWGVRRAICEVLGRWGKKDNEIIGLLQGRLTDDEPQVRVAAEEALERLQED